MDWGGVEKYVDLTDCYQHYLDPCFVAPKVRVWYLPWTWCYKAQRYAPRTGMFCVVMCCQTSCKTCIYATAELKVMVEWLISAGKRMHLLIAAVTTAATT